MSVVNVLSPFHVILSMSRLNWICMPQLHSRLGTIIKGLSVGVPRLVNGWGLGLLHRYWKGSELFK